MTVEGIEALEKLYRGECKIWTREDVENFRLPNCSKLPEVSKGILYFIAEENNRKRIVLRRNIMDEFKQCNDELYSLKRKGIEMAFNVTIPEIVKFYGFKNSGYTRSGCFNPRGELKWLKSYLDKLRGGNWKKNKLRCPRNLNYRRYWIAVLEPSIFNLFPTVRSFYHRDELEGTKIEQENQVIFPL